MNEGRTSCRDQLLHDPGSVAFLTKVAATSVVGCQFAVLTPWAWVITLLAMLASWRNHLAGGRGLATGRSGAHFT